MQYSESCPTRSSKTSCVRTSTSSERVSSPSKAAENACRASVTAPSLKSRWPIEHDSSASSKRPITSPATRPPAPPRSPSMSTSAKSLLLQKLPASAAFLVAADGAVAIAAHGADHVGCLCQPLSQSGVLRAQRLLRLALVLERLLVGLLAAHKLVDRLLVLRQLRAEGLVLLVELAQRFVLLSKDLIDQVLARRVVVEEVVAEARERCSLPVRRGPTRRTTSRAGGEGNGERGREVRSGKWGRSAATAG